jgi:hypothetical protein
MNISFLCLALILGGCSFFEPHVGPPRETDASDNDDETYRDADADAGGDAYVELARPRHGRMARRRVN